jgi:hypothetical protein
MALIDFAFHELQCVHLECLDRCLTLQDLVSVNCQYKLYSSYEIDMSKSSEELFKSFRHDAQTNIRKAMRVGLIVEQAHDLGFADDYHEQLTQVFAKQSLRPTYGIERVRELIRYLGPTGHLLLLRVRDCDGRCIATSISLGTNEKMYAWGAASCQDGLNLRPNEFITWSAMQYWKERGVQTFDFVGLRDYKKKYGAYIITVPWVRKSKYPLLSSMRTSAQKLIRLRQKASLF